MIRMNYETSLLNKLKNNIIIKILPGWKWFNNYSNKKEDQLITSQ